jgi:hypothetical protein
LCQFLSLKSSLSWAHYRNEIRKCEIKSARDAVGNKLVCYKRSLDSNNSIKSLPPSNHFRVRQSDDAHQPAYPIITRLKMISLQNHETIRYRGTENLFLHALLLVSNFHFIFTLIIAEKRRAGLSCPKSLAPFASELDRGASESACSAGCGKPCVILAARPGRSKKQQKQIP